MHEFFRELVPSNGSEGQPRLIGFSNVGQRPRNCCKLARRRAPQGKRLASRSASSPRRSSAGRAQLQQAQVELQRLKVTAPRNGRILRIKVWAGEFVAQPLNSELMILGNADTLSLRVDIDESDIPASGQELPNRGYVRGDTLNPVDLQFVRVKPYIIPK